MAQETGSQNKNMGLSKNQIYAILGVLAALLIILAIVWNARQDDDSANQTNEQTQNNSGSDNNGQKDGQTSDQADDEQNGQVAGNVSSAGILKISDNSARGNYMLLSEDGKIYVSTKRNYSSLLNKEVALTAEGTLNSFTFLDFTDAHLQDDLGDVGGATNDELGAVAFNGTLQESNSSNGNYTITSGNTVVYLQTVHDYSAWIGSEVELNAEGTLDSFTGATLQKI